VTQDSKEEYTIRKQKIKTIRIFVHTLEECNNSGVDGFERGCFATGSIVVSMRGTDVAPLKNLKNNDTQKMERES